MGVFDRGLVFVFHGLLVHDSTGNLYMFGVCLTWGYLYTFYVCLTLKYWKTLSVCLSWGTDIRGLYTRFECAIGGDT